MKEIKYVVKDELGIHARPAGLLVKAVAKSPCKITIAKGEKSADLKRLLAVMQLGVKQGEEITITIDGEGEEELAAELTAFLEANL